MRVLLGNLRVEDVLPMWNNGNFRKSEIEEKRKSHGKFPNEVQFANVE
ncbi:hypothetical protein ETAA8_25280 [Anatilimnocola aggregata]|uniref:Uncharacterized protein n=1 Tax=Anatilimnocola aggregata TaxID=2528021 RepID=A0A517YB29_9BACT|nr:hypothetical protein ETAA8_25280 [Anatilimnocola aggregata]